MRTRNFIIGAFAALVTLVSCQEKEENLGAPKISLDKDEMIFEAATGEQTLTLTATRDWIVDKDVDWVVLDPEYGDASANPQTVTVTVLANDGLDRETEVVFTIGMAKRTLTVKQDGPGGSEADNVVYYNDFDKEKAVKGNSWTTYLDSFDGWKNAIGTGAANCGFSANGITVRTVSRDSASEYSDYEGSGMNYLWFAKENHFAVTNIALDSDKVNYTLSFGSERNLYNAKDNTFVPSEFKVYISADAKKWVELQYTFPEGCKNNRWDLASTTFTLPKGTSTLNVYFTATLASAYLFDDLKLAVAGAEGTKIDFSTGIDINVNENTGGGNQGGEIVGTPSGDGTEASPYNVAGITKKYQESGVSEDIVYVSGTISEFKGDFPAKYNSADIYISDDGKTAGQFFIFHGKNFGNTEFAVGDLKLGDKVVFKGEIAQYDGSPQLGSGVLVSLNGKAEDGSEGGGNEGGDTTPKDITDVTVEAFKAAAVSEDAWYRIRGTVDLPIDASQGNYNIVDNTGTIYVYKTTNWNDYKADVAKGGTIVVVGHRGEYNGNPQIVSGYIESYDGSTETPVEPAKPIACTKIEKVADLAAGTYYMAGYLESYTNDGTTYDWSAYPYHVCTGVGSKDIETSNYSYSDNSIVKGDANFLDAVDVVLEAVDGKANTYYVKIDGGYLYSTASANRKLAVSDTKAEWVATDFEKGGILLTGGGVNLGTAGATSNMLRSYTDATRNLRYGLVFFKKN